jgi:2-methylcitrate dehydratase PrpD
VGPTEKIAEFVVRANHKDIPSRAVELAKRCALDTVAVALAGCAEAGSQAVTRAVKKLGGKPEAGIIGGGFCATAPDAALANGTIAHALDYDDCAMKMGHPSVMVLPVVLALAEKLGASGRDALAAYIIGLEIEGKVALRCDFKMRQRTLNHQCCYGCLGAVAAAARMLALDVAQTRMALGIAADLACGIRANHGTMMGPMTAGNAGRAGIMAGLLAQEGVTASMDIIEAKGGFCHTLAGPDGYALEGLAEELGNPYYILSPGIGLKKYPSCYHSHRSLDALFQLMDEHQLTGADVAEVEVGTSERALRVLAYPEPATPYQGKYSLPYVIGCALLDRKVNLETFTEEKMRDPAVREAQKKVRVVLPDLPIWPGLADVGPETVFVGNPITIRTKGDRTYSARVDTLRGDPELPLSDAELRVKYTDCARSILTPEEIEKCGELILHLDALPDIGDLMNLLTHAGRNRTGNEK